MLRHAISNANWKRIADLLSGNKTNPGRTARDNRLFLDAVLQISRTGFPWGKLPMTFGKWSSICRRFIRLSSAGVWERVFAELQDPDLEWIGDPHNDCSCSPARCWSKKVIPLPKPSAGRVAAFPRKCTQRSMPLATRFGFCFDPVRRLTSARQKPCLRGIDSAL